MNDKLELERHARLAEKCYRLWSHADNIVPDLINELVMDAMRESMATQIEETAKREQLYHRINALNDLRASIENGARTHHQKIHGASDEAFQKGYREQRPSKHSVEVW